MGNHLPPCDEVEHYNTRQLLAGGSKLLQGEKSGVGTERHHVGKPPATKKKLVTQNLDPSAPNFLVFREILLPQDFDIAVGRTHTLTTQGVRHAASVEGYARAIAGFSRLR